MSDKKGASLLAHAADSKHHKLKQYNGVMICDDCGTALHKTGYWWLGGYKSKSEPQCTPWIIPDLWKSEAIDCREEYPK